VIGEDAGEISTDGRRRCVDARAIGEYRGPTGEHCGSIGGHGLATARVVAGRASVVIPPANTVAAKVRTVAVKARKLAARYTSRELDRSSLTRADHPWFRAPP